MANDGYIGYFSKLLFFYLIYFRHLFYKFLIYISRGLQIIGISKFPIFYEISNYL